MRIGITTVDAVGTVAAAGRSTGTGTTAAGRLQAILLLPPRADPQMKGWTHIVHFGHNWGCRMRSPQQLP